MRKSIMQFTALAVVLFSACSQNNENVPGVGDEKASFMVKLALEDANSSTRATAQSTAIPATSWSNINQVQLFLYDASNNVRFSDVITPSGSNSTFTYTDVPVGTYTIVAVANAKSSTDAVTTYVDGGTTPTEWTMWNVRQKQVQNMVLTHKASTFPSFCAAAMTGKSAFAEPAEIFMGTAAGVQVSAEGIVNVPQIILKREVSLMRVRLNVKEADGTDNTPEGAKGLDFTQDASIMLYRLPDNMNIASGVANTSSVNNVLAISGSDVFRTANPTTGYTPATILGGNFTMWRDVVVFPNNGGRSNNSATTGMASAQQQYFVVISAKGKSGHVLGDGTTLPADATVYWSGLVKENFVPNVIREVNMTLRTGGTTDVPTNPTEYGGLTITVGAPAAWDSNIVASDIIL